MDKKIIAVDCDGVLADLDKAFCDTFGMENRHMERLTARYPKLYSEIETWIIVSSTYEKLDIVPLGCKIVKHLNHLGFEIHIVTARPEHCTQVTGLWLKRNKIPFHYLSVGIQNKAAYYAHIYPAFVIEDDLKTAKDVSLQVRTMLIDQPWNDEKDENAFYRRISSFEGFLEYLIGI